MNYAKEVRDMLLLKDAMMPSTKHEEMSVFLLLKEWKQV